MTTANYRIGNYVRLEYNDNPEYAIGQINTLGQLNMGVKMLNSGVVYSGLMPGNRGIPLTKEWLLKLGFVEQPETRWKGNGQDYQPQHSGTSQRDFVKDMIIFRFQTWYYTDKKGETHEEDTTHLLLGNDSWYHKISEGLVPCMEIHWVHDLQNIVYALRDEELELIS